MELLEKTTVELEKIKTEINRIINMRNSNHKYSYHIELIGDNVINIKTLEYNYRYSCIDKTQMSFSNETYLSEGCLYLVKLTRYHKNFYMFIYNFEMYICSNRNFVVDMIRMYHEGKVKNYENLLKNNFTKYEKFNVNTRKNMKGEIEFINNEFDLRNEKIKEEINYEFKISKEPNTLALKF